MADGGRATSYNHGADPPMARLSLASYRWGRHKIVAICEHRHPYDKVTCNTAIFLIPVDCPSLQVGLLIAGRDVTCGTESSATSGKQTYRRSLRSQTAPRFPPNSSTLVVHQVNKQPITRVCVLTTDFHPQPWNVCLSLCLFQTDGLMTILRSPTGAA